VTEAELDQLCARRDIWVRRAAIAAIVGVVLYVGGWVIAGMIRPDYDPSERAISELFELGAPWASRGWVVVGLLVSGFSSSMEIFVGGRLLQGLGCGAALTAMYVAVADAYPANLRTHVFSLFATAWVVPSIAGPFIAGALVDLFGWRSVFLVVAGFAALSTFVVRAAMGRRLAVRQSAVVWGRRPAYAAVAAVGVVALHVAGHGTGARAGLLLIGGLLVLAATMGALLPRGTMRADRGLPAVVAARGVFGGAFACVEMSCRSSSRTRVASARR